MAPDAGIWEPRGEPKQHTHSLALCWVALDRLLDLRRRGVLKTRHGKLFHSCRDQIRDEIEKRGFNAALGSFTSELDGNFLDATSLLLGWYGYAEPSSPRMQGTFRAILGQLSPAPGLLYRYRHPGDDEGAFGICGFWWAEHLARGGGSFAEVSRAFEQSAAYANDVGLFSEEVDPRTGAMLGNFPQNFSHVGVINAALSLAQRAEKEAERADKEAAEERERHRELASLRVLGNVRDGRAHDLVGGESGVGFTRMNVPFLLGSMFTPNRDRAKLYGVGVHFVFGILFAWLYLVAFQIWDGATWWKGLVFGAVHGAFLLSVVVTLLPAVHPRMVLAEFCGMRFP